jgi:hypothetical protein
MSYPGNPTEDHNHNSGGCVAVGSTTGTVISGPNGVITEVSALGCIPTANFGENIISSGTPSGVKRPQTLRGSLRR